MDDKQLAKIQAELLKGLDDEQKIEEHIISSSVDIAAHLLSGKPCQVELDGAPFMFKYKLLGQAPKQIMFIMIANMNLYKIAPEKYKPFTAQGEVDQRYSMQENLAATVEAFLRHRSGRIKPEMLEADNAYAVGKR